MKESVMRKCRESMEIKEKFFEENSEKIISLCAVMANAFSQGHRLFVMGNGGSSCDALHVAVEFIHPIIEKRRALPAVALTTDTATITAIGNDQDFSKVFSHQIDLLAREGDMALAISTSGASANVLLGLQTARKKGMTTIAFTGKDGGRIPEVADYCFIVRTFSIHRIQEVHVVLLHIMWDMVHVTMGEEDVI